MEELLKYNYYNYKYYYDYDYKTWERVWHILGKLELLLLVEKPVTSKGWSNVKIVKGLLDIKGI